MNETFFHGLLAGLFVGRFTGLISNLIITLIVLFFIHPEIYKWETLYNMKDISLNGVRTLELFFRDIVKRQ